MMGFRDEGEERRQIRGWKEVLSQQERIE